MKRHFIALLALLHVAPALAADRHPLDIPLKEYLVVLAISALGGFVSWYTRIKAGSARGFSLLTALGETCTSVLAGLVAFYVCTYFDMPQLLTISAVAVSGHMGARAIASFEQYLERRMGQVTANLPQGPKE